MRPNPKSRLSKNEVVISVQSHTFVRITFFQWKKCEIFDKWNRNKLTNHHFFASKIIQCYFLYRHSLQDFFLKVSVRLGSWFKGQNEIRQTFFKRLGIITSITNYQIANWRIWMKKRDFFIMVDILIRDNLMRIKLWFSMKNPFQTVNEKSSFF